MKQILRISMLFLLLSCTLPAQKHDNGIFFSGSFGANEGPHNQIRQRNAPSIVLSTGFGLPLINKFYLYTKLSYVSRANYQAEEYYNFVDADLNTVRQLVRADASFNQLIFNGGLQYNIYITDDLTLGINSGLTYVLVNQQATLPDGTVMQRLDDVGVLGTFGGLSLEKRFEDGNFSLFGEAQYNYAKKNIVYFRDKFSGMNFTIGGRFYLN